MKQLLLQYRGLKREIYILFIGKLVTAMGSFVWPMLTFFFTKKLGFSDGLSTLLIAIASVLSFPAALLGGKLADKYSRKAIIILFDCLTFLFYALAAILPITVFTAALLFLASLFQTIESPAYDALNADYSTSKQREKAYSLSYLGFNLGFIAGASFSGILFQNHIQLGFLLNGCAVITSTILIFFFVHKKNAITACKEELSENYSQYELPVDEKISVIQIFRQRPVVFWVLVISCFASMPSNLVGILLPLQLKEGLGNAGAALYGYLNSLNGFVVVLFTPILTVLLKKFTELPKSAIGILLFVAGIALFSLGNATVILFIAMFIFTLGEVVVVLGSNPYSSRRIPASHRGRVGGFSSVFHSVFSSLTQFAISFLLIISNNNYKLLWLVFIGLGLFAAGMYAVLYKPDKRTFPKLYCK